MEDFYERGVSLFWGWGVGKDEEKAKECYCQGAKSGCPKCKYALAILEKEDVQYQKECFGEIFEVLLEQAKKGDSESQRMVSTYYLKGDRGIEKDEQKAFYWLECSARQENLLAMFHLAGCYFQGECVEKDKEKAVFWLKKSAVGGYEKAATMAKKLGVTI